MSTDADGHDLEPQEPEDSPVAAHLIDNELTGEQLDTCIAEAEALHKHLSAQLDSIPGH